MSVKIIIEMKDAVIKTARVNGGSTYVAVPKKWNEQEVLAIPIPESVEPYIDDLLEQDRIILNNTSIYTKTVKKFRKYVYAIYLPKRYLSRKIIIVKKNS